MADSPDRDIVAQDAPSGGGGGPAAWLRIVLKYFWVILLVSAVVIVGGLRWMKQQPREYRAVAQVLVDTNVQQLLEGVDPIVNPVGNNYWANREFLQTQLRILTSRSIAGEVAEELNLAADDAFLALDHIEDPAERNRVRESIDVGRRVQSSLTVDVVPDSHILSVTVITRSAQASADIANAVTRTYRERHLLRQAESIDGAASWLQDQYQLLRQRLEGAEDGLVAYRRTHGILAVTLQENVSLLTSMQTLAGQLEHARIEADRLQAVVQQINRAVEAGDITTVSIDAIVDNPLIQSLKEELIQLDIRWLERSAELMPTHPDMVALQNQRDLVRETLLREIDAILNTWQQRYRSSREMERNLAARLRTIEEQVQRLGEHEVVYNRMRREAESLRDLFGVVERRLQEVDLTRSSQFSNVEILEPAHVPTVPWNPERWTQLGILVLLGLALGAAAAFGLDALDNTVKSKEELERFWGLPFLGFLPSMQTQRGRRGTSRGPARFQKWNPDTFVHDFPRSTLAEACRTIRTNLLFLDAERPLRRLLVTSAGPREGKTTSTSNLGIILAQSGARILLIDTDLRRPRLHRTHDLQADVGLTSVLLGEATLDEAIQATQVPNLFILPSGPIPTNPTELMLTERFQEVLAELDQRFDRLVLDSPPVAPVTDAVVLTRFVDGILLVVSAGQTRREILERSLDRLRGVRANIVGVVLNRSDGSRGGYGYYGSGYYYRASTYYGDDPAPPGSAPART